MQDENKIIVAKTAGFCFGVKRAVNTVYEQIESGDNDIYTYGNLPGMKFIRTKTLGAGDELCDFCMEISEKHS